MNRLGPTPDDDMEQDSMMWGPEHNQNLAYWLCSDPHQSLEEIIHRLYFDDKGYFETEIERALRKEIERDWDVYRYPDLVDFLVSPDGARLRKLLVIDVECARLADQLIRLGIWLAAVGRVLDDKYDDPEKQQKQAKYREQFPREKKRFAELAKELHAALSRLN